MTSSLFFIKLENISMTKEYFLDLHQHEVRLMQSRTIFSVLIISYLRKHQDVVDF